MRTAYVPLLLAREWHADDVAGPAGTPSVRLWRESGRPGHRRGCAEQPQLRGPSLACGAGCGASRPTIESSPIYSWTLQPARTSGASLSTSSSLDGLRPGASFLARGGAHGRVHIV